MSPWLPLVYIICSLICHRRYFLVKPSFAPLKHVTGSAVPGPCPDPSSALDVTGGVYALPAGRPSTLRRARSRACTRHPRSPRSLYHDATARTGEGCRPACAACLRFNSCPDTGGGAGASRSRSHARGASSVITRAVAAQAGLQWPQLASRWLETGVALTFAHASRQAARAASATGHRAGNWHA